MTSTATFDWSAILAELEGLEVIQDSGQVTKLSLDYFHFSPILQEQLAEKRADLVVRATTEAEVLQVARVCVRYKVPLTVRGAGTGNYGQCVPLYGGIVLDLSRMNQVLWIEEGMACVQPGVKMAAFDKQARQTGWELRMYPSTYRTATIGGFIEGGSGGIGSVNYGMLRDRGNLQAVRVVTLEDEPRVLELRGDDTQKVNHAYGTNGIITQLEFPLAPAYPWQEVIVTFNDFLTAAKFGQALSDADGLVKKLVTICAAPIPNYFGALKPYFSEHQSCALLMIAESSLEALRDLVGAFQGEITYSKSFQEAQKGTSLAEFTWNHTTLHARNVDSTLTYLQTFYFNLDNVEKMYHQFGEEVMIHLEFLRLGGKAIPAGLQLVRYTTAKRLQEIIDYHENNGMGIANPHTYILEDGGRKVIDPVQLKFKQEVDPYGLFNPGKMRAFEDINE
ncbi:FAD-binding oxidoreductase [Spirulina sp. CS-785/01]|nr:FAD-binding oxidoreductase [Spirulina sp. CS-785/01]MDB9314986.1 FAD-binding oxidoreductase [Spirulina sp. CS-785/01]